METPIKRLISQALAGELPPAFPDDGDREYGRKTPAMREAQRAVYSQIYATPEPTSEA